MAYTLSQKHVQMQKTIPASQMKAKDIGIIVDGAYAGKTVIRTYNQIVGLDDVATLVWTDTHALNWQVRLLEKGQEVVLTVS